MREDETARYVYGARAVCDQSQHQGRKRWDNMNGGQVSGKKGSICRYFASSGSCYYGNECQFYHTNPTNVNLNNDLQLRDGQTSISRTGEGSHSPAMDPLFQAFAAPPTLPPESKLQTYLNATPQPVSTSVENSKFFVPRVSLPTSGVTSAMGALTIDSNRKLPSSNAAGSQFMPISTVIGPNRLTHSASSPSFTQFGIGPTQSVTSAFSHFGAVTDASGNRISSGVGHNSSLSPQESPLLNRRSRSPLASNFLSAHGTTSPSPNHDQFVSANTMIQNKNFLQESVEGTTYFYTPEEGTTNEENQPFLMPDFHIYSGNPAHIEHLKPKANAPSFFLPDELRMDILHRHSLTMAQANPEQYSEEILWEIEECDKNLLSNLPAEVDIYHNLCPLDSPSNNGPTKSNTFGFVTSVYKATNMKTGVHYCLRRIHGFRLTNTKFIAVVDMWKKLQHSNLVHLREVFTTKAFGDHSIVFVYDYHPGADTLMNQYFSHTSLSPINGFLPGLYTGDGLSRSYSQTKSGLNNLRQHAGLLPESLIWAYIVQLSSVLRTIHAAGLACRAFEPSKILITGKSRLRLNCCGICDVLGFDANQPNSKTLLPHFQQEDLAAFGKVVLALACNSLAAVQRQNLQTSMELVTRNYSADLRNLILYLLSTQTRARSINDIMPMIGARFYTQLDAAQMRSDVIENELAKEVENGRLFRLLVKLGTINERSEYSMDPTWSETGDRYLLKLFRDYLFHQVTEDGRPWLDMSHVVQCLNKLDAGVQEKICLMSRDEQNVLVVSYAELKQYFESSFEALASTSISKQHVSS
ncbi:PAN2-PAN3 deadenylation complex subunit pan3 isoform X3 [Centruroides vittatus]|uniref:PAN2-PAN3 deadenylation complex subunit pan3 isoform X3 n=1 Tax=Centruroides vittatus TaxID=120091 RepID=UPI00350FEFEF